MVNRQHIWYEKNKEKKRIQSKEMRASWSDEYRLYRGSKQSAKKRSLPYTLNLEDIQIPEMCPVFGTSLTRSGREPNSVSIDRIDNSRGYHKDNISLISRRANRLKADATLDEIRAIHLYMLNHNKTGPACYLRYDAETGRLSELGEEEAKKLSEKGKKVIDEW